MRRKRPRLGSVNYWPGYVDAMTNVVLNLLFMVAMFGITIAVFNRTPKHSPAAPFSITVGVPKAAAPLPARVPVDPLPTAPLLAVPAAPRATPNLVLSAPLARPAPGAPPAEDVAIVVADAWQRRGGPDAIISRRVDPQGRLIMTFDVPAGADPVTVLNKSGVGEALRTTLSGGGQGRVEGRARLWTSTDRADALARRVSYLSLMTLRNTLIKNGYSSNSIDIHLFEGASSTGGGQRIFLAVTP